MAGCLVPLLTLAVGAGLQAAGAEQARGAMNRRTKQELQRQKEIQDRSRKTFSVAMGQQGVAPATQRIESGQGEREQAYSKVQDVPLTQSAAVMPQGTSSAVMLKDAATRSLGNKSRAALSGYDTWLLDQAIANLRTGQQLGQNAQEAQRSQAILPIELQAASHAGDTLAGLGSLVSTAGSLYGMMPSTGGGLSPSLVRVGQTPPNWTPWIKG